MVPGRASPSISEDRREDENSPHQQPVGRSQEERPLTPEPGQWGF